MERIVVDGATGGLGPGDVTDPALFARMAGEAGARPAGLGAFPVGAAAAYAPGQAGGVDGSRARLRTKG